MRLIFAIECGTPIREDTVAVLKTQGLTGIAYVEFGATPSRVRLTLRATLSDNATRQVLAQVEFDNRADAPSADVSDKQTLARPAACGAAACHARCLRGPVGRAPGEGMDKTDQPTSFGVFK